MKIAQLSDFPLSDTIAPADVVAVCSVAMSGYPELVSAPLSGTINRF